MNDPIAIVGAGVVGAVAALGLARRGWPVLLLERRAPELPPVADAADPQTWPLRHVALGADSVALLDELGVGDYPSGAFERISVWEALGTAELQFSAAEAGLPSLGCMAELPALTSALWDGVVREERIEVCSGATLASVEPSVSGLELGFDDGSSRTVAWLVGADGAQSRVRTLLGEAPSVEQTGHFALVTVARMAVAHEAVARQRFLPEGPLALLPMQYPDAVSVVWSQDQASAERRMALSAESFAAELGCATGGALGAVRAVGGRGCFPINQLLAASFLPHPRVMLVGDAARVVHPLAGLGVNLGIDDVQALLAAFTPERPPAPAALRRWARRRKARSRIVQSALKALQRGYGASGPRSALLRNVGVRAVNASALLRQLFIHEALGADRSR